ncbi:hypothetical protein GHO41_16320 [Pseudomonas sp. FSL R10-0399]|nr:hypothetical protein [Pseudomonas sp. FSL R10-0399]
MAAMIVTSTDKVRAMAKYLSQQQGIRENVNFLDNRLKALASKMRAYPERLRVDAAFHLPFRDQQMVDDTKGITVTPLLAADAVDRAIYGLTALLIERGSQHPCETLRVPGVIALPADWIKELDYLNGIKSEIESLIVQIEDQHERSKVWKTWPYMSGLQAMRKTWIANGPKKVTFFWESAPSVLNKTAKEWIAHYSDYLKKLHGHIPKLNELDEGDKSSKFVMLIAELQRDCKPNENIAAFRPGQPHVRARVTFHDSQKLRLRPAPTPIVYEYGDSVPTIIPLSNWEPEVSTPKRETRKQMISTVPVVDGLWFYRYLESYRYG